jgi:hypothetical protein
METRTVLGPLEAANFNHWAIHVVLTTAIQTTETRLSLRELAGRYRKYREVALMSCLTSPVWTSLQSGFPLSAKRIPIKKQV